MKKISALVLAFMLCMSLAACGGSSMKDNVSEGISDIQSSADSAMDAIDGDKDNSGNNDASSQDRTSGQMSEDEAKQAALKHAGLTENDITGFDISLERDDGILKYEIDFHSGEYEYDYEVNARTGGIISANKERN